MFRDLYIYMMMQQMVYIVRLSLHCINLRKRSITRQLKGGNLRFVSRNMEGFFLMRDLLGNFSASSSCIQSGSKIWNGLSPDVACENRRLEFTFANRNSSHKIFIKIKQNKWMHIYTSSNELISLEHKTFLLSTFT